MTYPITVSDLTEDLLDQFYEVFVKIITQDFPEYKKEDISFFLDRLYSKIQIRLSINSSHRKTLVSIKDNSINGFLLADKTFGGVGFISWLGVDKESRSKGVGTKLLEEYESFVRSQNGHLIEVYTFSKSQRFYKKNGFYTVGIRKNGYFNVENIIMDKNI